MTVMAEVPILDFKWLQFLDILHWNRKVKTKQNRIWKWIVLSNGWVSIFRRNITFCVDSYMKWNVNVHSMWKNYKPKPPCVKEILRVTRTLVARRKGNIFLERKKRVFFMRDGGRRESHHHPNLCWFSRTDLFVASMPLLVIHSITAVYIQFESIHCICVVSLFELHPIAKTCRFSGQCLATWDISLKYATLS